MRIRGYEFSRRLKEFDIGRSPPKVYTHAPRTFLFAFLETLYSFTFEKPYTCSKSSFKIEGLLERSSKSRTLTAMMKTLTLICAICPKIG
ncbi:hypothetical protein R6Q59_010884 [Mikania micrantha]